MIHRSKLTLLAFTLAAFLAGFGVFAGDTHAQPVSSVTGGLWENLGGVIRSDPECVSWGSDRIDCFAEGADAAMWQRSWDGSAWGGWVSLGGVITSNINCTTESANRIDCFARGTDNAIWHRRWDGSAWIDWESIGGPSVALDGYWATRAPECVSWGPNRIDCFARGGGNAMWHRGWDGSAWGDWENLGGVIISTISCTTWSANRIDCFASGADRAMWHRWWDGSAWGGWESLGGAFTSDPECVSWGPNHIDCFAVGDDKAMWQRGWDGSAWGGWVSLGGEVSSDISCTTERANRIDCFARGPDHAMWHRRWDGSAWGGWESLGGQIDMHDNVYSRHILDCVSWGPNRIDCFFARGGGSAMWRRWWDGLTWRPLPQ